MKVLTAEERLELIHRPFFITTFTTSYPRGGVAVADNFFGFDDWAVRPGPTAGETGTQRGGHIGLMGRPMFGSNDFGLFDHCRGSVNTTAQLRALMGDDVDDAEPE